MSDTDEIRTPVENIDAILDVDNYFNLQEKIHNYFGYVEDWKVMALVDHRSDYWILHEIKNDDGETYGGEVFYHDDPFIDGYKTEGNYYSAVLYMQRFLPQWIYRTKDFTMICMDTQCDDNKYIGIFSNMNEQPNIVPYV